MNRAGPLVRGASPLSGSFSPRGGEAGPIPRSGRIAAVAALVLSVLWLAGFGSLFAVPLSILALSSGQIGRSYRWVAVAGLVLGAVGLAFAAVLVITSGIETL